jgi:hypothetical protein
MYDVETEMSNSDAEPPQAKAEKVRARQRAHLAGTAR